MRHIFERHGGFGSIQPGNAVGKTSPEGSLAHEFRRNVSTPAVGQTRRSPTRHPHCMVQRLGAGGLILDSENFRWRNDPSRPK